MENGTHGEGGNPVDRNRNRFRGAGGAAGRHAASPPGVAGLAATPSRRFHVGGRQRRDIIPALSARTGSVAVPSAAPLTAAEVIDSRRCRLFAGMRGAADLAVVVLPDEGADGARFAVVDSRGRVFDGRLPFVPEHASLGKNPQTGVLVGFGRTSHDHRPVQVVHDGTSVYARDFVWQFGVGADGAAYFAIEGSRHGGFANMVVRNVTLGIETHVDVTEQTADLRKEWFWFGDYVSLSPDDAEIRLSPVGPSQDAPVEHTFIPVNGAERRTIAGAVRGGEHALFASSRLGYFYVPALEFEEGTPLAAVFGMNTIALDAKPTFFLELDADSPCALSNSQVAGLRVREGELAYQSRGVRIDRNVYTGR